jgi:hypothetical protein
MGAEFTYTKRFLAVAYTKIWLKSFGWIGAFVYTVAIILCVCLLHDPDVYILGEIMLAVLGTTILICFGVFLEQMRRVLRFTGLAVTVDWDNEFFSVRSLDGSSSMKWNAFRKVRLFREFWCFFVPASACFFIPTDRLAKADREFILERLRLAKVRIC